MITQRKVLYIYYASPEPCKNYLIGEIIQEFDIPNWIYTIKYYPSVFQVAKEVDSFRRISGCPFQRSLVFRYINRLPWFIQERVPHPKRPSLKELLNEVGLEIYDPWEYMKRTNGICIADRYYVSDSKDLLNFHNRYLHELSITSKNSNNDK